MTAFRLKLVVAGVALAAASVSAAQSTRSASSALGADALTGATLDVAPANQDPRATGVTTLTLDTRNTGVDLGLQRNADGTVSAKVPTGSSGRPALRSNPTDATAGGAAAGTATSATQRTDALGGLNDVASQTRPGTSALGNPTSAGRENGNSGTNNGRSTPGVSGGTGLVNSGASGNGLNGAAGAVSGNTGAGRAASGNTGVGNAATGTTGAAPANAGVAMTNGSASADAATAAEAASNSRSVNGSAVSGRMLGGSRTGASGGASPGR